MIGRIIRKSIHEKLFTGKAVLLFGPLQVGKATLLKSMIDQYKQVRWLNADEQDVQALFDKPSSSLFKKEFSQDRILIIDEAQRIKNIGLKLKLVTDEINDLQLIVTGSSAFELANAINEPLIERKWEYQLYPLSYEEMVNHHGLMEERRLLNHRLIYGYYPDVVTALVMKRGVKTAFR